MSVNNQHYIHLIQDFQLQNKQNLIYEWTRKEYKNLIKANENNTTTKYIAGNNTILDTSTNLIWQKNSVNAVTFNDALNNCDTLNIDGYGNWFLPNINELRTITNYNLNHPILDEIFTGETQEIYWSSTVFVGDGNYALTVNFENGKSVARDLGEEEDRYYRCARLIN